MAGKSVYFSELQLILTIETLVQAANREKEAWTKDQIVGVLTKLRMALDKV